MSDVIVIGVTAPQAPAAIVDVTGRPGTPGSAGYDGWTPILASVPDGARRVLQVQSWTGGAGLPPPAGQYVAPTGLVDDIAEAIDIRGTQGPQGLQGPRGQDGAVIIGEGAEVLTGEGPPSNDIGAINQLYLDTLTGDLYKKNEEETWDLLSNLRGPQGEDGRQGVDGEPGPPGVAGANGFNGWSPVFALVEDGQRRVVQVTDWTGGQGAKPVSGVYIGETGFVANIAQAVSVRGPQGVAGAQGAKGDTGNQGPQGLQGPPGAASTVPGPAGTSIYSATHNPVAGDGNNGDSWINADNGDLFLKSAGTWSKIGNLTGPQGERGPDGPEGPASTVPGPKGDPGEQGEKGEKGDTGAPSTVPGPAGTSIYTATANPGSGDGNAGDSWINSLTGNIYLKTGPTTWTLMGNLKGPQGEPGNDGADGPQGPPGEIDSSDYATTSQALVGSEHKIMAADTMLDALAWQNITYAATVAPNMNSFINGQITLIGDMTLNPPTNAKPGRQIALRLAGSSATERTITFGANYVGDVESLIVTNTERAMLYIHVMADSTCLVAVRKF